MAKVKGHLPEEDAEEEDCDSSSELELCDLGRRAFLLADPTFRLRVAVLTGACNESDIGLNSSSKLHFGCRGQQIHCAVGVRATRSLLVVCQVFAGASRASFVPSGHPSDAIKRG